MIFLIVFQLEDRQPMKNGHKTLTVNKNGFKLLAIYIMAVINTYIRAILNLDQAKL